MDLFRAAERLMVMNDRTWARPANALSVYSRIGGGIGIFLALYSAHWVGWWACLPVLLAVAWTWANPRLFAPPDHADGWAQRGVLGERAFLNRANVPVPAEFERACWLTTGLTAAFMVPAILGLAVGDLALGLTGWLAAMSAKIWFVDRCALLWDAMKDRHPTYEAWARADWDARLPSA
ncbi:MAG: DUF6653 family protein [Pseudomonadota bacterium]